MVKYFGELAGTGLQIYNGYLYFGNDEQVVRYKLKPGELLPDEKHEVIASGFPEQNQHATKSFAINPDGDLFVNVGGPSNACMEVTRMKGSPGEDPCQQLERHAGIWLFDANKTNQLQEEDGLHYATGIRNAVAIEWNDKASHLYVVQHGRDQLYQFFPGMYTVEEGAALPAEEFFLVEKGDDFGWPYCYYDQFLNKKVLAPEYGGDGKKAGRCSGKKDPIMAFPGHYAPNDLVFYHADQFPEKYHEGAFIAFHGSWNRAPEEQEGYNVVFVPFEGAYPSGDWEVFADGFAGVETIKSPGDAEYRPTGVALGPDGSLYVSDSRDGKIWKISYKK
jgi:glucose/arabinose dehydrogenase